MDTAREIRSAVSCIQAAARYGYPPDRSGFLCCPFHGEKTPSLKVYPGNRGWHCFGCGEGGDVIDFVMQLFGLDFAGAVDRLNTDFGLCLERRTRSRREISEAERERRKREQEKAAFRAEYEDKQQEFIRLRQMSRPEPDSPEMGLYARLLGRLDYLEWWFRENPWRAG